MSAQLPSAQSVQVATVNLSIDVSPLPLVKTWPLYAFFVIRVLKTAGCLAQSCESQAKLSRSNLPDYQKPVFPCLLEHLLGQKPNVLV